MGPPEYIPFVDNYMFKRHRENYLGNIMKYLPSNDILAIWIKDNLGHLLVAPVGDTNILKSSVTNAELDKGEPLSIRFVSKIHSNNTGVYAALNNKGLYIGSAKSFKTRWLDRYSNTKEKWFLPLERDSFKYTELAFTNLHHTQFYKDHPNVQSEFSHRYLDILFSFSTYELRLLEQAVISYTSPSHNTNKVVTIPSYWNPNKTNGLYGARPVDVKLIDTGEVFSCRSIKEAELITGIMNWGTSGVSGSASYSNIGNNLYSPKLNKKVTFIDPNLENTRVYVRPKAAEIVGVPYDTIPAGEVWVYNSSIELVKIFKNAKDAAEFYKIKGRKTYAETFTYVESANISLYFARNKNINKKKKCTYIIHNTVTGVSYSYSSYKKVAVALGYLSSVLAVKPYIDTTHTWGPYKLLSQENAAHLNPISGPDSLNWTGKKKTFSTTPVSVVLYNTKTKVAYLYPSLADAGAAVSLYYCRVKARINTSKIWGVYEILSPDKAVHLNPIPGPKVLITKSDMVNAYIVDVTTTPETVHTFKLQKEAALYATKYYPTTQSIAAFIFIYCNKEKLYKDKYLIYSAEALPAKYTNLL